MNASVMGELLAVNNWTVYDGIGLSGLMPNSLHRHQGMHINAWNWHNSFSLVFEDGRYMQTGIDVHALLFWGKKLIMLDDLR